MSIDKVGGSGAAGYGPSSTTNDQTTATVKLGEHTIPDVANRLGVDVSELMKANPQILDPQQKLTAGQELTLPQRQSTTSPRDVATGQASGKRMHEPIRAIAENAPTNYGQEVKLSAAHLPQLQGGASSSTPAADKSAKYEHSQKYGKLADEVAFKQQAWKQDTWKQEPLSKDPRTSFDGKDPRIPLGAKDPRIPFDAGDVPQVQGGVSSSTPAADKSAKFEHSKKYSKADEGAGKIDTADQLLRKNAPVAQKSTTMFEITQDVTVNKAKTADKAFNAMDGYIKQ